MVSQPLPRAPSPRAACRSLLEPQPCPGTCSLQAAQGCGHSGGSPAAPSCALPACCQNRFPSSLRFLQAALNEEPPLCKAVGAKPSIAPLRNTLQTDEQCRNDFQWGGCILNNLSKAVSEAKGISPLLPVLLSQGWSRTCHWALSAKALRFGSTRPAPAEMGKHFSIVSSSCPALPPDAPHPQEEVKTS